MHIHFLYNFPPQVKQYLITRTAWKLRIITSENAVHNTQAYHSMWHEILAYSETRDWPIWNILRWACNNGETKATFCARYNSKATNRRPWLTVVGIWFMRFGTGIGYWILWWVAIVAAAVWLRRSWFTAALQHAFGFSCLTWRSFCSQFVEWKYLELFIVRYIDVLIRVT